MPADFRVSITNAPGKDAYPISSFTWLLIPAQSKDAAKGKILQDFLVWMLDDGQKMTSPPYLRASAGERGGESADGNQADPLAPIELGGWYSPRPFPCAALTVLPAKTRPWRERSLREPCFILDSPDGRFRRKSPSFAVFPLCVVPPGVIPTSLPNRKLMRCGKIKRSWPGLWECQRRIEGRQEFLYSRGGPTEGCFPGACPDNTDTAVEIARQISSPE